MVDQPTATHDLHDEVRLASRFIDHVDVEVEVVLGTVRITVAELAALSQDSVLEIDRVITEAADIRVNGQVIGQGEIVTVGDHFAVRVTRIGE
jgi:flagellar motor switch protein FliN/FliY